MIVVIFIASIIAFTIAAMIVPILVSPIPLLYRAISRESFLPPNHFVFIITFTISYYTLFGLTHLIWKEWNYETGWLFPLLVAIVHFILGGTKETNLANKTQSYCVVYGAILYGIMSAIV